MQTGRCQCGEISFEIKGDFIALYICHCRECQKQSASAFGISADLPRANFNLIQGQPKYWYRGTAKGGKLKCVFCPTCGTRLWHDNVPMTETLSIKAGTLDKPIDVSNATHVWTSRKLPGVIIPDTAVQFPED